MRLHIVDSFLCHSSLFASCALCDAHYYLLCCLQLSLLGAYEAVGVSPALKSLMDAGGPSNGVDFSIHPAQCSLKLTYHARLAGYLILPLLGLTLIFSVCFALYKLGRFDLKEKPRQQWEVIEQIDVNDQHSAARAQYRSSFERFKTVLRGSMIVYVFLVYNTVARETFFAFDQYESPIGGKYYLAADFSVETGSNGHKLALVFCILWLLWFVIGWPVAVFTLIRRGRHKLDDPIFRSKYGFIYDGLDLGRGYWWWELIVMSRKIALTAILVFWDDAFGQAMTALFVIFLATALQLLVKPYCHRVANALETASLFGTAVVLISSLYLANNEESVGFTVLAILATTCVLGIFLLVMLSDVLMTMWDSCKGRLSSDRAGRYEAKLMRFHGNITRTQRIAREPVTGISRSAHKPQSSVEMKARDTRKGKNLSEVVSVNPMHTDSPSVKSQPAGTTELSTSAARFQLRRLSMAPRKARGAGRARASIMLPSGKTIATTAVPVEDP